jgi:hypothetical protein
MSGEKINLEWLGNRVMTMSAEIRDLQLRDFWAGLWPSISAWPRWRALSISALPA